MSGFKAGNGNYKAPDHKSSLQDKAFMDDGDSQGVASGLSSLSAMDSESAGPMVDYEKDPATGNATERIEPRKGGSVKAKGKNFNFC